MKMLLLNFYIFIKVLKYSLSPELDNRLIMIKWIGDDYQMNLFVKFGINENIKHMKMNNSLKSSKLINSVSLK